MAAIKPLDKITQKWTTVTPQRTPEYEAGIRSPRVSWADAAGKAADNYKAGVVAAANENRFPRAVAKATDARWTRGALEKGVSRWGPGIQLAGGDYQTGFAPYREAIAALTLPPRFANRDPRNVERVRAIVNAMIETKKRQG